MAKTKKKQESHGVDLLENPDVLASKAEEFFESKKNQNILFGVLTVVLLVVGGVMFFRYQNASKNREAQQEMFQAIYYFEADSLAKALNGDGNNYGFLDITDEYSGTKAANLAQFYIGAIYMRLSDFEGAIRNLEGFASDDYLLQARAYSLIGDAYMELDDFDNAVDYYERAAGYRPNEQFTPVYLKKLAVAQEARGNYALAAAAYGTILSDFVGSALEQEAKKHKARLEGLADQ